MLADDRDGRRELLDRAALDELLAAVDRSAHGAVGRVLLVGPRELLEPEAREEGADEEDAVVRGPLDGPVVARDVRALHAAVLCDEGDAVDEIEALPHAAERAPGSVEARLRVGDEPLEELDLAEETLVVDAALPANRAGGEPPDGLAVRAGIGHLGAHLLDGLLGVGGVERGGELLLVARDEVERAGEPRVEAGRVGLALGGDPIEERLLAVDPCGPPAEVSEAGGVGGCVDVGGLDGDLGRHGKTLQSRMYGTSVSVAPKRAVWC